MNKNMVRIPAAFCCLVAATLVMITSCTQTKPKPITIGKLSDKETDHSQAWYRISNAAGGEKTGRYLTHLMKTDTRYNVAFDLSDPSFDPAGADADVWVGFCEGVRVSGIPGCPCEPPFVLISKAEPGPSTKKD